MKMNRLLLLLAVVLSAIFLISLKTGKAALQHPPKIYLAGYWDSRISSSTGGKLDVFAFACDPDADRIKKMEIFYAGMPTGITLPPYDLNLGLFWMVDWDIPPGISAGSYLFEMKATDEGGLNSSLWPYLEVLQGGTPTPTPITWQRTFGGSNDDFGASVQQTKDGGYIVAGNTYSYGVGKSDSYLIKVDEEGNVQWENTFGGSKTDWAQSVQQTLDNGFIIVGCNNSFGAGLGDVDLIKTDSAGGKIWEKLYGGNMFDGGNCVQQTQDGGFIISGVTRSYGFGEQDVYLIKTDAYGNVEWQKTFGGDKSDQSYCIQLTQDGGYIIVGYTYSFGAGDANVYLIKTDSAGNKQWERTIGAEGEDIGKCVQQTADGGYIIVGYTDSFSSFEDIYLIKTDANGMVQWEKTFGGASDDEGKCVKLTADGGYIIFGDTYSFGSGLSDLYLVKTDGNGNKQWERTFGGSDLEYASAIQLTKDGGYIFVGWTLSFGAGATDIYLVKTDALGNINSLSLKDKDR